MAKRVFIFTNRKHSQRGVMSTVLGVMSTVSLGLTLYLSYRAGGETIPRYGTVTLFTIVMALIGFWLGMYSRREPERYRFFPYLGIVLNGFTMGVIIFITYLAAYR